LEKRLEEAENSSGLLPVSACRERPPVLFFAGCSFRTAFEGAAPRLTPAIETAAVRHYVRSPGTD